MLTRAPTFRTRQAHDIAGIITKLERAGHRTIIADRKLGVPLPPPPAPIENSEPTLSRLLFSSGVAPNFFERTRSSKNGRIAEDRFPPLRVFSISETACDTVTESIADFIQDEQN